MESLAVLVAVLFTTSIIAGPIAIGIARIKVRSPYLRIVKRSIQAVFVLLGVALGGQWILLPSLPLFARILGIISLSMCYIALRLEYFPQFRLIAGLTSWRPNGRSNGKDGHGPQGQH